MPCCSATPVSNRFTRSAARHSSDYQQEPTLTSALKIQHSAFRKIEPESAARRTRLENGMGLKYGSHSRMQ